MCKVTQSVPVKAPNNILFDLLEVDMLEPDASKGHASRPDQAL